MPRSDPGGMGPGLMVHAGSDPSHYLQGDDSTYRRFTSVKDSRCTAVAMKSDPEVTDAPIVTP